MAIATEDLRGMLDDAWDDAPEGAATLRETLRTRERSARANLAQGQIASVGKNSANTSFAYGTGVVTLADIARGWRHLIDLYDSVSTVLATTDEELLIVEMRSRLVACREFTKDFTLLTA